MSKKSKKPKRGAQRTSIAIYEALKANKKLANKKTKHLNHVNRQYKKNIKPDQPRYHEYIKSKLWENKRNAARTKYGSTCEICKADQNITTHHNTYYNLGSEPLIDLTVLCYNCHHKFHLDQGVRGDKYYFNLNRKNKLATMNYKCTFCSDPKTIKKYNTTYRDVYICNRHYKLFEADIKFTISDAKTKGKIIRRRNNRSIVII